jgi:hypothetical protein
VPPDTKVTALPETILRVAVTVEGFQRNLESPRRRETECGEKDACRALNGASGLDRRAFTLAMSSAVME